jgi:hypothetical protein
MVTMDECATRSRELHAVQVGRAVETLFAIGFSLSYQTKNSFEEAKRKPLGIVEHDIFDSMREITAAPETCKRKAKSEWREALLLHQRQQPHRRTRPILQLHWRYDDGCA